MGLCVFYSQASFSADWKLKKKYEDVFIYKSKSKTRLTINYSDSEKHKKITENIIKENHSTKKEILAFIGITEWETDKVDVRELKNNTTEAILKGSYVDSNQKKIHFKEYHYYKPSEKLQILLTNKSWKLLKRDSSFEDIKEFKLKYGF